MTLQSLSRPQLDRLEAAIARGLQASAEGLARMIGRPVGMAAPRVELVPFAAIPGYVGGGQEETVAVYLGVSGDLTGHIVLLLPVPTALRLADLLLEQPPGTATQLTEIEMSALGEVGNLTGSFLLNSLADEARLRLLPSTPTVLHDYAGAVLGSIAAELSLVGDRALVVETDFQGESDSVQAHFFLLPEMESLSRLVGALEMTG